MRKTDEQLRNLKVDLSRVSEWERELSRIEFEFQIFDISRIINASKLLGDMHEEFRWSVSTLDRDEGRKMLEKWITGLNYKKLARMADDYLSPSYIRDRTSIDFEKEIQGYLAQSQAVLKKASEKGLTSSFFVSFLTSKVDNDEFERHRQQYQKYTDLTKKLPSLKSAIYLIDQVRTLSQKNSSRIKFIENKLLDATLKSDAIVRFEKKHGNAFAKAAATDKTTRHRGSSLKRIVTKTESCPYCQGPLGSAPHLDHIYPVAKGGLSIIENLVWCCSSCNGLKSDKGLVSFLTTRGLSVEVTLSRLAKMGKHV
jgi:5-methylcytosine-specific restriction endonuclease McrA